MLFLKEKKNTILQKHKIPSPEIMRPLICGNIQKYAYTMTTISCTCTLMTFSWWDFNIWHASTTYLTTFFFSVGSLKDVLGNSSLDLTKTLTCLKQLIPTLPDLKWKRCGTWHTHWYSCLRSSIGQKSQFIHDLITLSNFCMVKFSWAPLSWIMCLNSVQVAFNSLETYFWTSLFWQFWKLHLPQQLLL